MIIVVIIFIFSRDSWGLEIWYNFLVFGLVFFVFVIIMWCFWYSGVLIEYYKIDILFLVRGFYIFKFRGSK